jgi:hypothetical protein
MPELLYLHDVDILFSLFPEALQDYDPDKLPHIVVSTACGHPPVTTVTADAARRVLSVVCMTCGAQAAIAVEGWGHVPGSGSHGDEQAALYRAGCLTVCCVGWSQPLSLWNVAPYAQELD